ncbi:MAG TPA: hypothetical protein VGA02_08120 [Gemmatimonadales bacterium]|jgi:hypothetical protein
MNRVAGRGLPAAAALFASVGTLLCCALPALLVLVGFGAAVASVVSALPWLATLSRHKAWVFAGTGLLIAGTFYSTHRLAPRLLARHGGCPPDAAEACETVGDVSRAVLWVAAAVYAVGFTVAYVLGPILLWLDG